MQPDPPDLDELVAHDAETAAETETAPVVVVDRRRGGLPWALVPVLMALCVAAGVVASRPDRPVRPWLVAQRVDGPVVQAPRDDSAPREPTAGTPKPPAETAKEPVVETPVPAEVAPAPAEVTEPPAPQKRTVLRPTGIGFDPDEGKKAETAKVAPKAETPKADVPKAEAPKAVQKPAAPAAPKPEPKFAAVPEPVQATEPVEPVKTEEVEADILREADLKRRERQAMEEAKPDLLRPDPAVIKARQEADEAEARAAAVADRGTFHAELARILKDNQVDTSSEIQALCARSPRAVSESAKKKVSKFLAGPGAGVRRATRIKVLRSGGFPEATILSDIAEQEMKHIGSRSGPARLDEVWVLAARILLSYPPSPTPAAAGRAAQRLPQ